MKLSLRSAYIKYGDNWFGSENGVPTGGKTSVDIANIAVFFVLNRLIYDSCVKPKELVHFIRFVDDGSGIWNGTKESFLTWFQKTKKAQGCHFSAVPPGQSSKPVVFEIGILSLLSVQSEGVGGRPTGAGKVVTLLSFQNFPENFSTILQIILFYSFNHSFTCFSAKIRLKLSSFSSNSAQIDPCFIFSA